MRPRRVDANQRLIVNEFIARGASVCDLSQSPRCLDLLVGYRGKNIWVEVKDGNKPPSARKLTPAEDEIFKTWRGAGPVIVESSEDVERVLRESDDC